MKKVYACFALFTIFAQADAKVGDWIKERVEDVKDVFQNPKKTAENAAKDALKVIGINVDGIVSNVNNVQDTITIINKDVSLVQKALDAPASPISKSKQIVQRLQDFQKQAQELKKTIGVTDITSALSSSQALNTVVQKLATGEVQQALMDTYNSYDAVIKGIDSIEMSSILTYAKKTLYDFAGLLDSVLRIRDYAGTLAKILFTKKLATSILAVSMRLRTIAKTLDTILDGGEVRLESVQGELAGKILSNISKVAGLADSLRNSAGKVQPLIIKMNKELDQTMKSKNKLIRSASSIKDRIAKTLTEKIKTVRGIFDVPRAAIAELKFIMNDIKTNIDGVLLHASNAIGYVSEVANIFPSSINTFRDAITFDLVTAKVRLSLEQLPGELGQLAKEVNQVRLNLPLKKR